MAMLRSMVKTVLRTAPLAARLAPQPLRTYKVNFSSSFCNNIQSISGVLVSPTTKFLQSSAPQLLLQHQPVRSVTKFSLNKGKRKTVKAVIKRFKRLDWGAWIRTHSGRQKKLFKKSAELKRRLRQHVFTNSTQSWLLDKMVTNFWRRPKHYIDDPYTPYHKRDEFFATKSKSFKV